MGWSLRIPPLELGEKSLHEVEAIEVLINQRILVVVTAVIIADLTPPATNANPFVRLLLKDVSNGHVRKKKRRDYSIFTLLLRSNFCVVLSRR